MTGSNGEVITSRASKLRAIEELLDQYGPDDALELVELLHNRISQLGTIRNAKQSPLLRLPAELIFQIGESLLDFRFADIRDKDWFREVLSLMQTCKGLRTILHPLHSIRLTCMLRPFESTSIWDAIFTKVSEWQPQGLPEHPIQICIYDPTMCYSRYKSPLRRPSTAAAMAGALECAIYGRLLDPPCVYIESQRLSKLTKAERETNPDYLKGVDFTYFVSHMRKVNIIEQKASGRDPRTLDRQYSQRTLSDEEGATVWKRAFRSRS